MKWRRKDTVRLADRLADLQWRREHDEPVPYTPVVLVEPPTERTFGSLWMTKAEGRLAWAFTMSSDKGQSFDEFMRQLRIIQRGVK